MKRKEYVKPDMTVIPFVAKPLLQITSPKLPFGDDDPVDPIDAD